MIRSSEKNQTALGPQGRVSPKVAANAGRNFRLDIGSRSDIGRIRANNEDACRVLPEVGVFVIADGMGGESHGELASEIAGDTIAAYCSENLRDAPGGAAEIVSAGDEMSRADLSEKTDRLARAGQLANRRIFETALKDPELRGMGATLVAGWVDGLRLSLVHVGDSRAYLLRSGALKQLTSDHTLVEEQIRSGLIKPEEAHRSKMQNVLIRALGVKEQVDLDVAEFDLSIGDVLLLCTDGLTRMAPDGEIAAVLMRSADAQESADGLVKLANEHGGEDNVSVIVVRIGSATL